MFEQKARMRYPVVMIQLAIFVFSATILMGPELFGANSTDDIYWSDCFVGNGLSARALAIKVDGDDVYVGGQFTQAGAITVNRIARWDGAAWQAMDSGFSVGKVCAIEKHGGYVYAGGDFTHAGDTKVDNFSRWDGVSWSKIGQGVGGVVYSMIVYNGDLLIGGNFLSVDGDPSIQKLARWDGSSWHAVAEVTGSFIFSMATDGTNLYIGGKFSAVDSVDCLNIAMWDGSEWLPLGGGLYGGNMGSSAKVNDIAINGTDVYAAGEFAKEGGTSNYLWHVGKWNGATWSSLGSGLDYVGGTIWDYPWAEAVACIDSNIYVGGFFDRADTAHVSWLAMWDGTEWYPLGSGVNYLVAVLSEKSGDLYVGGAFGQADGKESAFIALWTEQHITGTKTTPSPRFLLAQNRPNPFNPTTIIRFDLPYAVHVKLCVYSVKGELVATIVDQHMTEGRKEVGWDAKDSRGRAVTSGVYFYRLVAGDFVQTRKMVLLK